MRALLLAAALLAAFAIMAESASAQTVVKPYLRQNGTYVQPHVRSNPDGTKLNNWSTKGNVNPYTGKPGTKNP